MNIRANRYNDPALGAAFENIASLFAPPSAQDTAAYATAAAKKQEADRLAALWDNPTDPLAAARSSLLGIQQYGQTPEGFKYKVNADNSVTLQTNAADNARAIQTNLADNQRATITSLYASQAPGYSRPTVPANVAGVVSLPELPAVQGLPKPLSETEWNAEQKDRLVAGGAVSQDRLVAELFPGQGGAEYGLNPVYGRDKDGNVVVMQLGKDGKAVATAIPEGVTPDLSTKSYETALGTELGKDAAAAIAGVGPATQKANEAIALIDGITGGETGTPDPALESITGMIQGRLPPLTQAGTDLAARIDQLKGKAFLEAFESLKGGGAITELEGKVATDAIARLNRAQSDTAFIAALNDLRAVLKVGIDRAKNSAARPAPALRGAATPAPGDGAVPSGVDPALWEFMTPEERALFQ